jgi:valyl-tRNA synthetase
MEKTFEPRLIEARWRDWWERRGCFKPVGRGEPYCIMLPPPNVTGTLHMGHAFQYTLMDALVRYHRMRGHDTLWQPGTDHAGIATQMVVERNLLREGTSRLALGRERFVEKVWEWKRYSGDTIAQGMRRLGCSMDWSRAKFTMDPEYSRAVIEHFVRLYEDGLIYRGKRLVNWDPVLQTAISDLEVVQEEEHGKLWHIRYPLAGGATYRDEHGAQKNYVVVATTRPETMLGDAAVAVHPHDERYQALIGKRVVLPLCDREVPIVADEYVDREFGTGCVKITPAHDFNDYAVGQRHGLPQINIFTPAAAIGEAAPGPDRGRDRVQARTPKLADLQAAGLIDKIEDHKLKVPRGDRTGAVLEPYLTDQWFVDLTRKTLPDGRPGGWTAITQPALDAVADGRIQFVPENWVNTYNQWLNNIQDWCISRQLWWGHRIPAWYDAAGNVYVGRNEAEVRARHGLGAQVALKQDEDVFDTWFSSDLWPLATLGWPQETPELQKFYPTNVLVTGFDIIFFWVARMVMMGMYLRRDRPPAERVPFRQVYIHGLIRDSEGQKMSKSKGNVLDPLDLVDGISLEDLVKKRTTGLMKPETAPHIEKATRRDYPYGIAPVGADALRLTFAALASPGRDLRFDAARAEGYRNFCNKLWNAARYVVMNCEGHDAGADPAAPCTLGAAERWIVSRLQRVEQQAAQHFADYRFDWLAKTLYEFVWNEYCDWYLELSKPALQTGTPEQQRGTRRTLVRVLETALRLLHPLMPFITEELWQKVAPLAGKHGATIMLEPYPAPDASRLDEQAETQIEWLQRFILGVRQIRSGMGLPPAKVLPLLLQDASAEDRALIEQLLPSIRFLARVETPRFLAAHEAAPQSATALCGTMKLLVPMAGLIDKQAELARLGRQIAKAEQDLAGVQARLANPNFAKAPEAVQRQTRALGDQLRQDLAALRAQRERIAAL